MPNKPLRLRDHGIDKLFEVPTDTAAPAPTPAEGRPLDVAETSNGTARPSRARWEDTHHRRTFHCPDALWERLQAWCAANGVTHSAGVTHALAALLDTEDAQ